MQTENLFNFLPGLPVFIWSTSWSVTWPDLLPPQWFPTLPLFLRSFVFLLFVRKKKKNFFFLKDVLFFFFLKNSLHIFFTWFSPCHTSERSNISCRGIYFSSSLAKKYLYSFLFPFYIFESFNEEARALFHAYWCNYTYYSAFYRVGTQ